MRRFLTLTLLSLGLTGGVALADDHHDRDDRKADEGHRGDRDRRDHDRDEGRRYENNGRRYDDHRGYYDRDRRVDEGAHYRDYRWRPPVRFERHYDYRGYRWNQGDWIWNGFEWMWRPGYYVRITL